MVILFPSKYLSRSLGLTRNSLFDKYHLGDTLAYKQSIAAVKDGEILAVRLGNKKSRNQTLLKWFEWGLFKDMETFHSFLPFPNIHLFFKVLDEVGFDTWKMFDQLGCDHIHEDKAVCSSRKHGTQN